uniref:Calcineurin-like phosphoesterase domain-containing protein n=1 Tax=Favella ehrenbergii TaxID=182087 RepID=A0A7S3I1Z2_9SPIT|mmetsp:Transcript_2295/g.3129  ORF Transcript_2295/g.3129 Transcript_2295/m.3129 type:complete len:103 (-) Transcript_2295:39-347(-)
MTHDGPQESATCNANKTIPSPGVGFHKFGSSGLAQLVRANEEKLVVHIHGHCHDGAFVDRVHGSKFSVVNPGSLEAREYGVITLLKENGKWRLSQATKKYLS